MSICGRCSICRLRRLGDAAGAQVLADRIAVFGQGEALDFECHTDRARLALVDPDDVAQDLDGGWSPTIAREGDLDGYRRARGHRLVELELDAALRDVVGVA